MMPGLHPGLLLAGKKIKLTGMPTMLYISTAGGPGTRIVGMGLEIENGVGPYTFEWSIDAGPFGFDPSSGSGSTAVPYVSFSTGTYHDGGEWALTEVGSASLWVWAANGASTGVTVPVYAGQ